MSKTLSFFIVPTLIAVLALFQNCSGGFESVTSSSLNAPTTLVDNQPPFVSVCQDGDQQNGYLVESVVYPVTCGTSVTKTCVNGQWNRSETLFPSCRQQCLHPDSNQAADPGTTYLSFSTNQGVTQAACDAARVTSTCSASTGTFLPAPSTNKTCLVQGQVCAYTAGTGRSIPTGNLVGSTVAGFPLQSATYPTLCGAQVSRSCQANGQWTGTTPLYTSCVQRCAHPDSGQPMDSGASYAYYARQSGTQAECDASRVTSACQAATGVLSPVVAPTRYQTCSVVTAAEARYRAAKAVLAANCISCHSTAGGQANFALAGEQDFVNAGLIVPASISTSKIIYRLKSYPVATASERTMPKDATLSNADYITLTTWISSMPPQNGGSNTGGVTPVQVFQNSLNFSFRREEPIVMPINALMPLPFNVNGEFTVQSIVSTDIYRIRKYLGNSIDIGTRIPVSAKVGDTKITLTLNHVATELLRAKAVITLSSQATPNVLPQQITITIEPKDTDIVDAIEVILGGSPAMKTYDGKLFFLPSRTTNYATVGKVMLNKSSYPTFAQEMADGRTYIKTQQAGTSVYPNMLNGGVYLNEKISFFSALMSGTMAAISASKNEFFIGGATGFEDNRSLSLMTRYPSPVGPLKAIYFLPFPKVIMLTESGKVFTFTCSYFSGTPGRIALGAPVELNFGAPVIQSYVAYDSPSRIVFVTSNKRIFFQDSNSSTPSTFMADLASEPGSIEEIRTNFIEPTRFVIYVGFSTGKHYSLVFDPRTATLTSKFTAVHNPDFFMITEYNSNYNLLDPRTGQTVQSPIR